MINYQQIFRHHFQSIISHDFLLKQQIENLNSIPSLEVAILSTSSELVIKNISFCIPLLAGLELSCLQKAKKTKTKKPISGFSIRKNQLIGCKVTLRKKNLYTFLEKLIFFLLPRLRTLGTISISKSTFQFGMNQVLLFPELESHYEFFDSFKGCDIEMTTSSDCKDSCQLLVTAFHLPFLASN